MNLEEAVSVKNELAALRASEVRFNIVYSALGQAFDRAVVELNNAQDEVKRLAADLSIAQTKIKELEEEKESSKCNSEEKSAIRAEKNGKVRKLR